MMDAKAPGIDKKIWFVIILAFLPILILRDFTPANEGRYLIIADEAIRSGNFFSFTLHGESYADKPPFYLWLVMLCRWISGGHYMILLSLLSFVPACGITAIMLSWTNNLFSEQNRKTAILMLMTTAYFAAAALVVRMDMLMVLFMVLAFRSFWLMTKQAGKLPREQWLFGLWLFMALFTKGPLGLFIPLVATMAWLVWKRQWKLLRTAWGWPTWLVLFVGCSIWFGMTYHEAGLDYLNNLLFHQTVDRAVDAFHHEQPFYYYLVSMWYEWLPWSLFAVGGMVMIWIRKIRLHEMMQYFLCIVLSSIVLLSVISSKLQIYLLPVFPFLIFLCVYLLEQFKSESWVRWSLGIVQIPLTLVFPALLFLRTKPTFTFLNTPLVMVAAIAMSAMNVMALYQLIYKKDVIHSVHLVAYAVLSTLFFAGLAMPQLNGIIQ